MFGQIQSNLIGDQQYSDPYHTVSVQWLVLM